MAKVKTDERTATADDRPPKVLPDGAASEHDIARRAYDLYLARDRTDGHEVEDWLQAEQELRTISRSTAA